MNLIDEEREKYERIWAHKEYHCNSPGERLAPHFLKNVPFKIGESLIDFGCGTARGSAILARSGLDVYLFDHVNAVDPHIILPFICGNLWDMPEMIAYDWFYCCDVMEHVPPEYVDKTLDNISRTAKKGGYFQIALFASEWFGEETHLTVEKKDWWLKKLVERWHTVEVHQPERDRFVGVVKHD